MLSYHCFQFYMKNKCQMYTLRRIESLSSNHHNTLTPCMYTVRREDAVRNTNSSSGGGGGLFYVAWAWK